MLNVHGASALNDAVSKVIASYVPLGVQRSHQQVLVQPMIDDVVLSGVALTRTLDYGAPWLTV